VHHFQRGGGQLGARRGDPAIYRYYGSHEELIGAVIADLFKELTEAIERARDTSEPSSPGDRLLAMCRSLRAKSRRSGPSGRSRYRT
jgi:AcrR family transcriptional regulator